VAELEAAFAAIAGQGAGDEGTLFEPKGKDHD